MKIQYASDLHLEFAENASYIKHHPLQVKGEILVLAGDIGYLNDESYNRHPFWQWASDNYSQVIVCMGNHEFYKYYDIATLRDGECIEIRPNVRSYYNGIVHMEGVDIIISTLWSTISLQDAFYTEQVISDFRRILCNGEILTFAEFNKEHKRCLEFIESSIAESNAVKKIVVTHHVPSYKMQNMKFVNNRASGAFIVELEDYIRDSGIDYWIYGHSHYNVDVQIGKTLCVSNQLGYVFNNEHTTFDFGKVLEI